MADGLMLTLRPILYEMLYGEPLIRPCGTG